MTLSRFSRPQLVFAGVLCVSLVLQIWIWFSPLPYTDADLWSSAARDFAALNFPGFNSPIPPHPGTSILLPASVLIVAGIPFAQALPLTMAVLLSLCIACIARLSYELRPKSLWWVGASALLIPNPLYLEMTVPSALAALLTCIYVLLLLKWREDNSSGRDSFWLGMTGGILLATRVDFGAAFLLASLPFLYPLVGNKIFRIGGFALLFFGALNPYFWVDPVLYVLTFFRQVGFNVVTEVGFSYARSSISLAVAAYVLALFAVYLKPRLSSLPRDFSFWLIATTAVLTGIMLLSKYHPIRYFFPLMCVWEILLPLFIFDYLERLNVLALARRVRVEYLFIVLCVAERFSLISLLWIWQ